MTLSSPSSARQAEARRSSNALSHTAVTIEDAFWAPRLRTVRDNTLPTMYEQMKLNHYFDAEKRGWKRGMHPIPYVFWETDITKWVEAASLSLATHPDAKLDALLDETIEFIRSIQQPDGYLNLWFTEVEPEKRWSNMRDLHELYCAGHLIEASVAHFQGTGKRSLLDIVCRYADYLDRTFGLEEGKKRGYSGHPEIELALVKLYRATGEQRYLKLSQYFVDERGKQPHYFDQEARERGDTPENFWARTYEYNQSHLPVREQTEVVGHAVRAMYLYSAVADLVKEQYDEALFQAGERLWHHLVSKRLYITGGIGSTAKNEGFTEDYDLPNLTAYAESCASIGLAMWNHRLLQLDADSRYADLLERALYNGMLSGISLDGSKYFYVNPLESKGDHHRVGWFKCACCPPNIARTLMSLGQYVYTANDTDIFTHLYIQGTGKLSIAGRDVTLRQETHYPWDGAVSLAVTLAEPATFGLNLRIPGWCQDAQLSVNGETVALDQLQKGYARIEKRWQSGDQVVLNLTMPVARVYAHPDVREDINCVALQRGPLVYCLEGTDNAVPLHHIRLPEAATLESHFEPELLGGIAVIQAPATAVDSTDWSDTLYKTTPPQSHPHTLTAIPYYVWDQRQPGEMRVWIYTK
ncbi:glycoside hydrolase family 127 protein [Dictyobacter aurantiacus]|uniref:Glycoside hydrolase family 127 protein n=1 Tax=Dictyobacter aurantiacus TaxID=1936993 RepID=A0A401ZPV6_9CHLR|nr:beta-L-arabinofuranosidase domain-containing protein [Dictyobacter aurantiacus]GCE08938.1 hypothetical protein KDAU_62670 [Dictyobacter aurantiacus]